MRNSGIPPDEVDLAERFSRLAQRPGGRPRELAIRRAQAELAHLKPELSPAIGMGCRDLEDALLAMSQNNEDRGPHVEQAYSASQNLRDIAGSLGFSLVGLIASNLCTIFETVSTAGMPYPRHVIACHLQALQLAQAYLHQNKMPPDVEELAKGLAQTVQWVKNAAASTTNVADPGAGNRAN